MFVSHSVDMSPAALEFREKSNYSAQALNTIFPKYFRRAGRDANEYVQTIRKNCYVYLCKQNGQR